jgi:acetyl esterase/lipase
MLLLLGLALALATACSLAPPRRPGPAAFAAFFVGYFPGELPWHTAALAVALTSGLVVLGAASVGSGLVGLALVMAALVGLYGNARQAARARAAIAAALTDGLGDALAPDGPAPSDWRRVLAAIPTAPAGVARVRNLRYAISHRRQRLDVFRARDVGPGAARPCLLFVHGGAWMIGNKELQGLCTVQTLAAAGWVCFSMNYRLSPPARFPDHLHDVKRAIAWIRRHGAEHGADPGLLVVSGASAGAHLAALAALTPNAPEHQRDFPDVDTAVQGCVALYGVYDLAERESPFPHRGLRTLLERFVIGRRFTDDPDAFARASPLAHVRADAPPFFILHGERDSLVPVACARRFADRLRDVSRAPVVYAELPGGQHAFELLATVRGVAAVAAIRQFCAAVAVRKTEREAVG